MKRDATAERMRQLLEYDATTGVLRWKQTRGSVKRGDIAGTPHCNGYLQISVDKRTYLAHRVAWLITYGEWPADEIDHRDGDKRNNSIANLRECNRSENAQNIKRPSSRNKSGQLGVICDHGRFAARIMVDGKIHYLGMFSDARDAHVAYRAAKARLHPFSTLGVDH